jgi:hypothetical protein
LMGLVGELPGNREQEGRPETSNGRVI